eukprot:TRINITY_DN15394_c0_g1_i1.p1 TRINITY_DN15394_c0_g1~~TRINITY_DN15394_c0_g1_i1.p1  ORF type:complete len:214 (-),score=41.44 TRINITY_DN15394_c0_g1_i1:546-1187(-)
MSLLDVYYNEKVLGDPSKYTFSDSPVYSVPPDSPVTSQYLDFISKLPFIDAPEAFGLHENASISSALQESESLLSTVLSLQPREASGKQISREDSIGNLSKSIEGCLPENFDIRIAQEKYPVKYSESMNTVLVQELYRFNKLLVVVKKSLHDIQKALRGEIVMSPILEDLGNSLYDMKVPKLWAEVAYPSLKPLGSWVKDLSQRLKFFAGLDR